MKSYLLFAMAVTFAGTLSASPVAHRQKVVTPSHTTFLKGATASINSTMKVDEPSDLEIIYEAPEGIAQEYTRNCEAFTVEGYEASKSENIGSIVRTVTTDNGEIYFNHIVSEYYTETWVKATRQGDKLVFSGAQPIYEEWGYDDELHTIYLVPMKLVVDDQQKGYYIPKEELVYEMTIGEDGTLTSVDDTELLAVCSYGPDPMNEGTENYVWSGYGDRDITMALQTAVKVELPADANPEKWVWADQYEKGFANVYINGDEVYLSGMDRSLPGAWVKGRIEGDKIIVPAGQYLGPDYSIMYYSFFCGADVEYVDDGVTGEKVMHAKSIVDAEFAYDAANKTIKLSNAYIINSTADVLYPLYGYDQVVIESQNRNINAAPAAPYDLVYDKNMGSIWFQVPNVDVDGNLLDVNKLYYEVYIDGELYTFTPESYMDITEAMTLVPYDYHDYDFYVEGRDHTIYLYVGVENSFGIRSAYVNEEGNMVYSELTTSYLSSGIGSIEATDSEIPAVYYNLNGVRVDGNALAPGFYIKRQGTKAEKILVR